MFCAAHRLPPSPFLIYTSLMVTTTLKPSARAACRAAVLLAFVMSTLSFPSTRARNSFPRSTSQPSASLQLAHMEQHPRTANALHARSQHRRCASSRRMTLSSSSSAGRSSCWVTPAVGCRTKGAQLSFDLRRMRHHDHHSSSSSSRCSPRRGTSLSMKVKAKGKKGGGGGGGGGGGASTASRRSKQQKKALYIEIENVESDSWRYE